MAEQEKEVTIEVGMLVRVEVPGAGGGIPITTMTQGPGSCDVRFYHREKISKRSGRFLFGEVLRVAGGKALVKWAGPKYRTSNLPVEMLTPAKKT